ncbi:4-hydroxy-3-methylbut-2-en-1-yl diphosphate synthase [Roseibium sp.]|uniref:4-hydroxy-3-methylbut-2-en-1-yl diphosphate synthase n=1 Tax=Roseibium sp. TaxID=1936156 RepID=UPI003A96AF3C
MFFTLLERAVALALANKSTLFRTGWAYILFLAAINLAIGSTLVGGNGFSTVSYMTEPVATPDEGGLRLLAVLANLLVGFSIAIAYARRILIDARDFPLVLSRRTFRVIYKSILLFIIGILALIPLFFIAGIIGMFTGGLGLVLLFAAPFISLMVVQKFSVILPATAVDDPLTLRESWRATSGLGWPMAFSALVMSLLTACLIGIWYLLLLGAGSLTLGEPALEQIRSALFPMGAMLLSVWGFASLHATFYGLIRERFAARLGLSRDVYSRADRSREAARTKARQAIAGANRINRT